jgi:hypothetical protein
MSDPIRLYFDEDSMRASIIRALRARNIDVVTTYEAGLIGHSDAENLTYATLHHRTLFTFNRGDFVKLHTQHLANHHHHAGIIVSDQLETGLIVRRLLKLYHTRSAEDMKNWLEFLSNWR